MTIAQAFNEIAVAQGGTASTSGTIAGAIDALNDALAGSDQQAAQTIEDAVRLLGQNIGGGVAPSGTISITENGEGIDVAQYAYADVNVSGGSSIGEISSMLAIMFGGVAASVVVSADANLESAMAEISIATASAEAPLACAIPTGSYFAIREDFVELGNCAVMSQTGQTPQPMMPIGEVSYRAHNDSAADDYFVYQAETSAMYLITPLG